MLAANFPTPADRNWLRLFVQSLQDESTRFYHAYWTNEQQARGAAFARVNEQWPSRYYPKLTRFLNNTQQAIGRAPALAPARRRGTHGQRRQAAEHHRRGLSADRRGGARSAVRFRAREPSPSSSTKRSPTTRRPPNSARAPRSSYAGNGAVRGGALLLQTRRARAAAGLHALLPADAWPAGAGRRSRPPRSKRHFHCRPRFSPPSAKQIDVVLGGI